MRFIRTTVLWLAFIVCCTAVCVPLQSQGKKHLTYEQVFGNAEPRILSALPVASGWADDAHYLLTKGGRGGAVMSVDVSSGKESPYRDLNQFRNTADSTVALNVPVSHTEDYTVMAYLKDGDIYVLDTKARAFKRLTTTPALEKNPTVSPDGKLVAFTRDKNLYVVDVASGKETQCTMDGSGAIYNGWASWVYMEEILGRAGQYRAFWWSPDSKHLAFYRFDDSHVPVFPLFDDNGVHGSLENTRYPVPGDSNPEVRIGIVPAAGGKIVWTDFDEHADQYFGTPFWTPDGSHLLVQWMNRRQDDLKVFSVEPGSGTKKELYDERQPSWVEWFEDIRFLKDGSGFVLRTDKDGWMHLYLHNMDGSLKNRITSGEWSVTSIEEVDEAHGIVYFSARKENSARTDLYSSSLNGTGLKRLTFGDYYHTVKVSPGGKYFVTTYSNTGTPARMALCDISGKILREIGDSKTAAFDEYELGKTELFRVTTPDGYALPVRWTLPVPFDPARKYPVLISIYGGPNGGTVFDKWGGIGDQWMAEEGMIQMAIDHRGSGHFGKKGTALMHRCLGKWEMNDYIEVVKWLRKQGFVDSTKVCITGASYGGYVSCLALTAGAGYFTYGIADFSVTDWKLYDTHYTERYMGTPAENPEGYRSGSVLTYADRYKGLLRIVHGSMDDNVHMQNAIQLAGRLEELGKHFELMVYPNERHGRFGSMATHLRSETYRFYYDHLLGKPFPEQLFSQPAMGRHPF